MYQQPLSIRAFGLNWYTHHSWKMEMNWWPWIFSQQCPLFRATRMNTPSGSPVQQNTQSRAKEWPPFSAPCVVLDPGARAGLTSQVLTAISLAEPDQQRQGDSIKIGLSFTCNTCFCKYLSPNGIWRSTFCTMFVFSFGMPGTVKINKTKAVSFAGLWSHVVCPINTLYTVLYY